MGATVFFESGSELATLTNTFSVAGVPTDPATVSLSVTTPAGVSVTYTYAAAQITKSSTGVYTKGIPCSEAGTWLYIWEGTGPATDVVAGTWLVNPTTLQSLYCTPDLLKSRQGITDNYDDDEILAACFATSQWIEQDYCERFFYRYTATLTFEARDLYCLKVPDLVSITSLKTDADGDGTFETTWSASDYQLRPVNAQALLLKEPYTEIRALGRTFPLALGAGSRSELVQIVGVWGWPAIPAPVTEAAKILASDYLKLGAMAFGVQGYGEYGAVRARVSGPALTMLNPFRRNPVLMG